ncbi:GntR family transcriptional regulator [Salinicoccus hispanicus]|uniref:UTRA domain-containing protein n=1 Tax=Salinicoccus hispanicus TaxID=157225 RepID=A0A6N8U0L7_9STAP|nr:GntR family transcriptional regulator [Salinicoccus hispanicus]MXQ51303.1 UTRA domain-containing protein [Salinicoccus hispanicus]
MKLNEQVYNDLLTQIHNGFYNIGEKIPTEKELMEKYSISRSPVRDALKRLQNEGYINRIPKNGSIVIASSRVNRTISYKGGFSKYFSENWDEIKTITLDISEVNDSEIAEKLSLKNNNLLRLLRVRKYKGKPVFFLKTYYPIDFLSHVSEQDFYEVNNLRDWIQSKASIQFKYTNETLESVEADRLVQNHLELESGSPVLKINRLTYDSEHLPAEFVEYYVNTEIWKYHIDYNF